MRPCIRAVFVITSDTSLRTPRRPMSRTRLLRRRRSCARPSSLHVLGASDPRMEFPASFLSGLSTIILLDLVLAGDNAIVIALAARKLPPPLQKKAVFWGSFGAVAVRVALTAVVVWLLELPGLMLAGGLLLLPIAWKLLKQDEASHDIAAADGFWPALRTIVVADALM